VLEVEEPEEGQRMPADMAGARAFAAKFTDVGGWYRLPPIPANTEYIVRVGLLLPFMSLLFLFLQPMMRVNRRKIREIDVK